MNTAKSLKQQTAQPPWVKFQLCTYRVSATDEWKRGIAWLNGGFGDSDVAFIVDCTTGNKVPRVWDYTLDDSPLSHIDCNYRG